MAIQTVTLDPNAAGIEDLTIDIRNETGGVLSAGDLIYVSGWNEVELRWLVSKAQAKPAGGSLAQWVMRSALTNNTNGTAHKSFRLTGQDTSGTTVGDTVYLSGGTLGGFDLTTPDFARQVVGQVAVVNAVTGEVKLFVQPDSDTGFIRTTPASGEFPIRSFQKNAAGDVDVDFDDVAI